MTPTTRRAILNLALCCHNCRDPSPQRIARLARMVSRHYHRDSTLTPPQEKLISLAIGSLVVAHGQLHHHQRQTLGRVVADLRIAADCPNEPTPAVVYGIT